MVMKRAALSVVVGLFTLPLASNATVLIEKSLEDLTLESTSIVIGTVTNVQVDWGTVGERIDTFAEIEVSKWIKGDTASRVVTVKTVGGQIGDVTVEVPSAPTFRAGEEMVLFLHHNFSEPTSVVGWEQGQFEVADGIVIQAGVPVRAFTRRVEAILNQSSH